MPFGRGGFALTPPSIALFLVSLVLAIVAALMFSRVVNIPQIGAARAFYVLGVAHLVLVAGVVFRRV